MEGLLLESAVRMLSFDLHVVNCIILTVGYARQDECVL